MKIVLTTMHSVMNMSTNASIMNNSMKWANLSTNSQMKRPGHTVRITDERLPKSSETKKQEKVAENEEDHNYDGGLCEERSKKGRGGGRKVERKRGRPQLRWGGGIV